MYLLEWLALSIIALVGVALCLDAFYLSKVPELDYDETHQIDAVDNAESIPEQR